VVRGRSKGEMQRCLAKMQAEDRAVYIYGWIATTSQGRHALLQHWRFAEAVILQSVNL
jgi:hypothetical protein